ncbi:MAG: hypothetical protein DMF60_15545 [Acidobacteria bacterium]|nr:MAG: hypothetical protein DMF60_15545 [Acidobacteriota bacterium]
MASFKRIIVAVGVILIFTPSLFAQTRPVTYQSVLERLLDNQHVINVVDDFLIFWDQARDKTPAAQRRLWKRLVENKHRDYFDRAVYRTTDPAVRRAMLDEFLIRVPSQVEAIREFNRSISDVSTSPLIEAAIFFKVRFHEYHQQRDIYIGLSLFRFDGAVRPVQNEAGVPDTLCLGAELLSSYSREQIKIAVAHELFHLYHFGFLFQQPEQVSLAEFRTAHIPLMIEGMAAAGAEEVFPYEARESYLHFAKEELAAQEQDLTRNAGQFLDLIREGAAPEQYGQWFTNSHDSAAPPRGGYLLGYEVARRVLSSVGLEQMVRMTPAELREHAEEQLAAMANERILLMVAN